MRLLITTDPVGGVWRFTQELSAGLLESGCAVALVSLGLAGSDQETWALQMQRRWRERFLFTSVDAALEWMPRNEAAYAHAAPHLLRIAGEFQAELLHANQFCFGALPTAVPKIVTAHSDVLSWARACRAAPLKDSAWLRYYCSLVAAGLAEADAVVAPTAWMLHALAEGFGLPSQTYVVPNGRSIPPAPRTGRRLQAVTAGRLWDEAKNIVLLAEVRCPLPVLVAGERQCGEASAPRSFGDAMLVGALPERDLLALFQESAIYICTSRYEPFGLAPLEAALCGCAILANSIESLREVWHDGALYFDDAASLSRLLDKLRSNSDLLKTAQARSLRRAQRFTRGRMVEGYLAVYRSALERVAPQPLRETAHVA